MSLFETSPLVRRAVESLVKNYRVYFTSVVTAHEETKTIEVTITPIDTGKVVLLHLKQFLTDLNGINVPEDISLAVSIDTTSDKTLKLGDADVPIKDMVVAYLVKEAKWFVKSPAGAIDGITDDKIEAFIDTLRG